MIITVQDIRQYREIAANTQQSRVEVFIRECEQLDIMPAIGADEYERIDTTPYADLTDEEKMLLSGGTWEDADGRKHVFKGLKAAECYLTFARFIRVHPAQVTPFGVVVKESDDSQPATPQMIASVARDAEQIGKQYLADAVAYWRAQVPQDNCRKNKLGGAASLPRFKPIGD